MIGQTTRENFMEIALILFCLYLILTGIADEVQDYYSCGNRPT